MKRHRFLLLLLLVCALGAPALPGCATAGPRPRPGAVDDANVTTRVKTALINDTEAFDPRIEVDTVKGVVTLSGRVQTKVQEQKAIQLARGVPGVSEVKSTLEIQP
jgi:hyperosmotically inducible protein